MKLDVSFNGMIQQVLTNSMRTIDYMLHHVSLNRGQNRDQTAHLNTIYCKDNLVFLCVVSADNILGSRISVASYPQTQKVISIASVNKYTSKPYIAASFLNVQSPYR